MREIHLETTEKEQIIDITQLVKQTVSPEDGFVYIYCPHTTAALMINENADPDVKTDILKSLKEQVKELDFKHVEGNSAAHIKSIMLSKFLMIAVEDGRFMLGRWDGIMFCEFDGPRHRKLWVRVVED